MMEDNSSMLSTIRYSQLKEAKMKKELQSLSRGITTKPTRNGRLSTLTKQRRNQLQESMRTSDGTLTDHSTSDPECSSIELLKPTVTTGSILEDGSRTEMPSFGNSMLLTRHSIPVTGRTMP
jgi:hypothetical protein